MRRRGDPAFAEPVEAGAALELAGIQGIGQLAGHNLLRGRQLVKTKLSEPHDIDLNYPEEGNGRCATSGLFGQRTTDSQQILPRLGFFARAAQQIRRMKSDE
ncbi:hypothetical protein D3C78_1543930 [compost metagenome]